MTDGLNFIRDLEEKFSIQELSLASSIFSRSSYSNEITIMIDLKNKEDCITLLNRIKYLGIIKLKLHFILITLVYLRILLQLNYRT